MRRDLIIAGIGIAELLFSAFLFATGAHLAGLVGVGIGVLVLLIAWKVRHPDWAGGLAMPAPPVAAAPTPTLEDLADVPEPVRACPHCGYLGIRARLMGEGGIPGVSEISDLSVCPRCHYQGLAVEFRTREDYRAFLDTLPRADPAGNAA